MHAGINMSLNNVIILINRTKKYAGEAELALKDVCGKTGVRAVWVDCVEPQHNELPPFTPETMRGADMILACGGDGTLLQAAHRSKGSGIPLLGINIGYLGFITSIHGSDIQQDVSRIFDMDYSISERSTIDLSITRGAEVKNAWALNDAVLTRGDNPHLIHLKAQVGGRLLNQYRADGIIVATPTGSTAYSLAAGGPVVTPECRVLTITPICPHALSNRSVVVSSDEAIGLQLAKDSGSGVAQVDGMDFMRVDGECKIELKKSSNIVPIAFLPEINYYEVLGKKLLWAG